MILCHTFESHRLYGLASERMGTCLTRQSFQDRGRRASARTPGEGQSHPRGTACIHDIGGRRGFCSHWSIQRMAFRNVLPKLVAIFTGEVDIISCLRFGLKIRHMYPHEGRDFSLAHIQSEKIRLVDITSRTNPYLSLQRRLVSHFIHNN